MAQDDTQYFMVGTILHGWNPKNRISGSGEQLHKWIKSREWQLGLQSYAEKSPKHIRQARILRKVRIGDILIAKQMDPDFKSTWIKGIGICTKESTDDHTIGVNWIKDFTSQPIKISSSYRQTISKMSDSTKSRNIINEVIIPLLSSNELY